MNRFARLIALAGVCLIGAGCSTIRFHSGQAASSDEANEEWHHVSMLRLVELSDPVDLNDRCRGKEWSMVQTEHTFLNGLAGTLDNIVIGVEIWEPWTVQYTCSP
jgi:hypothetical protein